jgi:hypothetical protein
VSVQTAVTLVAADTKHGMTLDELGEFVQAAMRQEIPGDTVVKIENTWRSSIKRARVGGAK